MNTAVVPYDKGDAAVVAWCETTVDWLASTTSITDGRDALAYVTVVDAAVKAKGMAEEAQAAAAKLRFQAERRLGELIRAERDAGTLVKNGGDRRRLSSVPDRNTDPATLDDHGISRKDAARFNRYAEADPDTFAEALDQAQAEGRLTRENIARRLGDPPPPEEQWIGADQFVSLAKRLTRNARDLVRCAEDFHGAARFGVYPGALPLVGGAALRAVDDAIEALTIAREELTR